MHNNLDKINTTKLIDQICGEINHSNVQVEEQNAENQVFVDDVTFFIENSSEGLMTKPQFQEYLLEGKQELNAFTLLLDMMIESTRFNISAFPYKTKANKEYYYISAGGKKGSSNFKILHYPGIKKLIDGYHSGKYNIELSFVGLYTELKRVL